MENSEASEGRAILKEFGRKPGLSYDGRGLLSVHSPHPPSLFPSPDVVTRRERASGCHRMPRRHTQEESKPVSPRARPLLFLLRI